MLEFSMEDESGEKSNIGTLWPKKYQSPLYQRNS